MKKRNGFTLTEVITVIVIISLLATFIYNRITNIDTKTKEKVYNSKVSLALAAAKRYGSDNIDELNKECTFVSVNDLILQKYITEDIDNGVYTNPIDNSSMNDMELCITYKSGEVNARLKANETTGDYKVTLNVNNGYTRNSIKYVNAGENVAFQLISDDGYNFDNPTVSCKDVNDTVISTSFETNDGDKSLIIPNVNSDVTCQVSASKNVYQVNISAVHASVNPAIINVNYEEDATATIVPDDGFTLVGATYSCENSESINIIENTLYIYNVQNNTTCYIESKYAYNSILAIITNGTITSDNPISIGIGLGGNFDFTLNPGYNVTNAEPSCDFDVDADIDGNTLKLLNVQGVGTCTINPNPNKYTISFNANGGSGLTSSSKTVTYGGTYGTLPTIDSSSSCGGYSFDGWYTSSSGGYRITSSSTVTTTTDQTLFAHRSYNGACCSSGTWAYDSCNSDGYVVEARDNGCTGNHETRTTSTACTTSTYCSSWSTCTSSGTQTRTCTYMKGGVEYNDTSYTTSQSCCYSGYLAMTSSGTRCLTDGNGNDLEDVTIESCQPTCNTSAKCITTTGKTVLRNNLKNRTCNTTTTTYTCSKAANAGCSGNWEPGKSQCYRTRSDLYSSGEDIAMYTTSALCAAECTGTGYTCSQAGAKYWCHKPASCSGGATLVGSTCYEYKAYDSYTCDEGTKSGTTCYLYNQTSTKSGWTCTED